MLAELSKESSGASAAAGNMWDPAVERGWALQEGASKEPCPQGFTVKHGHNGRTAASRAEEGALVRRLKSALGWLMQGPTKISFAPKNSSLKFSSPS